MIAHLDTLLFRLFRWRIAQLSADGQVRFQPPDDDWRLAVPTIADADGNPALSLNVYLFDLRENRQLRSNERERRFVGNDAFETPPPLRLDCHYLVSAWSPVLPSPATEPVLDEHALLAEAAQALSQADPLDPAQLCAATRPGLPAIPVPAPLADELFPLTLLPVEGFPKLGEFWGAMGQNPRWKPCIYAVVTVPLKEASQRVGPLVTTAYAETLTRQMRGSGETFLHIGGTLRASAAAGAAVLPGATVELLSAAGLRRQLVRSDVNGRFVFVQVSPGHYRFHFTATGFGSVTTAPRAVPSPGGGYDLHF
jgi:hypothetical protein